MTKATPIYPYDDFAVVLSDADHLVQGVVIGWDEAGDLHLYGGGIHKGERLNARDVLWLLEHGKMDVMIGFDGGV